MPKKAPAKILRKKTGIVVSNKMEKTVVVKVDEQRRHPIYHKSQTLSKKYHAHADKEVAEGAKVTITETKPQSKTKRWTVSEVHSS